MKQRRSCSSLFKTIQAIPVRTAVSPPAMPIWGGWTKRMRSLLGCAPLPRSSCRATCLTAIPSTASCSCPACDWRWVRVNGALMIMSSYAETYRRSIEKPEEFWAEAAEAIEWERRWDRVLDDTRPPFYRWFAGARLNTCWNALDRHVAAGNGERLALIWD